MGEIDIIMKIKDNCITITFNSKKSKQSIVYKEICDYNVLNKETESFDVATTERNKMIALFASHDLRTIIESNEPCQEIVHNLILKSKTMKTPKVKKIDPDSPKWERLANKLARNTVFIKPCKDCGYPVIDGYCCNNCGSNMP